MAMAIVSPTFESLKIYESVWFHDDRDPASCGSIMPTPLARYDITWSFTMMRIMIEFLLLITLHDWVNPKPTLNIEQVQLLPEFR